MYQKKGYFSSLFLDKVFLKKVFVRLIVSIRFCFHSSRALHFNRFEAQ